MKVSSKVASQTMAIVRPIIAAACGIVSINAAAAAGIEDALLTDPGTGALAFGAYAKGVPGGLLYDEVNVQAKVVAINPDTREVSLITDTGVPFSLTVGPEAINFDQLKVGDLVLARATQTLAIFVGDEVDETEDGIAAVAIGTPEGEKPGLLGAQSVQVTGTVIAIDIENRTATLEFADGSTRTQRVRDDVKLEEHHVGEKIVIQIDATVAVEVISGQE
jgi:hypothetical protein